ncbi:hypothetical protein HPB51_000555 [Rhipicephalus microplus]|uniref:Sulfotransferase domain-containing protein n=1 Tax=Rhipicephalus microplus TaxID=6941 RepID=A0A9J6E4H2_RHIMP|nr:hypothetical protein HPB51_000555 [Rhipicephalus microplus]
MRQAKAFVKDTPSHIRQRRVVSDRGRPDGIFFLKFSEPENDRGERTNGPQVVVMEQRKPYYQVIDGIPRSPSFCPELLRAALEFCAQKDDVLITAFPKSGTHWMLYITQLILKKGQPVSGLEEFTHNMRLLGIVQIDGWKPNLPLRLFATHFPLRKDTMNPDAKYVYVAQNPWDLCVSDFHHVTTFDVFRFRDGTFEEFFDAFLDGDCAGQGNYFDHVLSDLFACTDAYGEEWASSRRIV